MSETTSSTEIPRAWVRGLLVMLGFGVVGLGGGWLFGQLLRGVDLEFNVSLPGWPVLIVGGLIVLLATLSLHELGHLIGAALVGFRFMLFIVGPLKVAREGEAVTVRLNRDVSLAGGLAAAMPTDDRDLGRRMAVMIAGGPVTSLVLSLLSAGSAAWLNANVAADSPWSTVTFFAALFSLVNFSIGVATLIPGTTSGFDTDGAQLLDSLRGGHRGERKLLIAALMSASTTGTRPAALNPAQMERLLAIRENSTSDVMANFIGYYHWLDRGNSRHAGGFLELALQQIKGLPGAARPALHAEAAYFFAAHRRDAAVAREHLARAQGGMLEPHTRLRAEAAVLLAEGRSVEAAEKALAGLATVSRSFDKGGAVAEREWLEALTRGAA